MRAATGDQYLLRRSGPSGVVEAVITELAAGIRSLTVDGVSLTEPFGSDRVAPKACGIVLVPWPNRVRDARWSWHGQVQRLDVTEPGSGHASHGLLRNTGYRVVDADEESVTLAAPVFPQHGYPFQLGTTVTYRLTDEGIDVTHTIENHSPFRAPVAVGAHPYLRVGTTPIDGMRLTIRADRYLETDEGGIPLATRPVGQGTDLAGGPWVADLDLDTCFTGLTRADDADPRVAHVHRLQAPDGAAVELWTDSAFGYVQVFTPRNFPTDDGPRLAIAVEPMTAAPDALNSGDGLRWLAQGERWEVAWGIRHRSA